MKNKIGVETIRPWVAQTKIYAAQQCADLAVPHLMAAHPGCNAEEIRAQIIDERGGGLNLNAISAIL